MIYYFSGCGNSRFVAEELARGTGERLLDIREPVAGDPLTLHEGEALGFVCPVYAWAVPRVMSDFVKHLQLTRKPHYTFLACTCGDNTGRTMKRFAKLLQRKGVTLNAGFTFVMPETYINVPGFNLDTPERTKEKIDAAKALLPQVVDDINERREVWRDRRGSMPWLKSHVVNPLFYSMLITDSKFVVGDSCIGCGRCAQVCPQDNIEMVEGRPHWMGDCTNCMACYHHCPKNAINFGKQTVGKGQYYFGRQQ